MSQTNEHDTLPPSMDPAAGGEVEPPTSFMGIVKRLGPGLIIAGSIVGSGELIATTKTGAQAGMSLLWLIMVGCVIKVFVQIELGRFTITHGQTTLRALDSIPGPRLRVSWIIWLWLLMALSTLAQLGGIVGGVGQALAIACPFTQDYKEAVRLPSEADLKRYIVWKQKLPEEQSRFDALPEEEQTQAKQKALQRRRNFQEFIKGKLEETDSQKEETDSQKAVAAVTQLIETKRIYDVAMYKGSSDLPLVRQRYETARADVDKILEKTTYDDKLWAAIVAVFTIILLYRGRYAIIQNVSTALVVLFTIITVGNVFALQTKAEFSLSLSDFMRGFGLPEGDNALFTALATFGIIGVGASELVAYPYWCLEKGYARFVGPRSDRSSWADRARGWMKVMHYDAFVSMVIYTIATLAFFLMGVAVLHRNGLDPDGMRMVSTLSEQYVPVFGDYAKWLFLLGAVAVLYSTFMVATAGHSRMFTDCFKIFGLMDENNAAAHRRSVSIICVAVPLIAVGIFSTGANPVTLVFIGATMQALMLPLLGFAALYFRYKKTDPRIRPSVLWDVFLVISSLGLFVAGSWLAFDRLWKAFA